jgi:hypothetical protein
MFYVEIIAKLTGSSLLGIFILCSIIVLTTYGLIVKYTGMKFMSALVGYYAAGYLVVAIPLTIMLPTTNAFGTFFLASIWPIWLLQTPLGFDITHLVPVSLAALMFS